jgi:hypothetical protein
VTARIRRGKGEEAACEQSKREGALALLGPCCMCIFFGVRACSPLLVLFPRLARARMVRGMQIDRISLNKLRALHRRRTAAEAVPCQADPSSLAISLFQLSRRPSS